MRDILHMPRMAWDILLQFVSYAIICQYTFDLVFIVGKAFLIDPLSSSVNIMTNELSNILDDALLTKALRFVPSDLHLTDFIWSMFSTPMFSIKSDFSPNVQSDTSFESEKAKAADKTFNVITWTCPKLKVLDAPRSAGIIMNTWKEQVLSSEVGNCPPEEILNQMINKCMAEAESMKARMERLNIEIASLDQEDW